MSSSVAPPPPPTPPSGSPPPPATVSAPAAPEAVLRLPVGEAVEVRLVTMATQAQGQIEVDGGNLGRFSLRTSWPLPDDARLSLQLIGTRGDTAQFRLLAVDGKPPAQALADVIAQMRTPLSGLFRASPQPPAGGVGGALVGQAPGAVTLSLGSGALIDGVVLRAPAGGLPLAPGISPLTVGSQMTLRLSPGPLLSPGALSPPGPSPAPAASPPSGTGNGTPSPGVAPATPSPGGGGGALPPAAGGGQPVPGPTQPGATQPGANQSGATQPEATQSGAGRPGQPQGQASPTPLSPGTPATGQNPAPRLGAPTPSGPPSPGSGGPPAPSNGVQTPAVLGRLTGMTAANSAGGHTMVRVGDGLIALSGRAEIPAGTQVTLEVIGRTPPPAPPPLPNAPLTQPLAALPAAGGVSSWPTLGESLDLLMRSDPQAGRQLAGVIPGGDPRMVANTVAYVTALRAGDPRVWPGEGPLRALEKASERGRTLARRLGEDVREIGGRTRDGRGDWRLLQMPFGAGGAIDRIEIITRRHGHGTEDEDDAERRKRGQGGGDRFLINVTLSALGPLQIDGLYTKARRQLDIVIRTTADLPEEVRRQIIAIHARNATAMDLQGVVSFHVTDRFPGPGANGDEDGGGHAVTA